MVGPAAQNAEAKRSITAHHWDNQNKTGADAWALVFDVFLGGGSLVAAVSSRLLTLAGRGWASAIEDRRRDREAGSLGAAQPDPACRSEAPHANRNVPPAHCQGSHHDAYFIKEDMLGRVLLHISVG